MFAVGVVTLCEIFEFFVEQNFGFNMQKSGLIDTMWDLIVNSLGALLTSIAGYFYYTSGKESVFSKLN